MALVGESRCRAAGPFRDMTDSHMSGMIMHAMTLEETGVDVETDPAHDDLAALRERLRYPEVDGVLFDEAARCFEQGAYRAALVMTWLTIAEGLRYRFTVAAERDPELMSLLEELAQREKERYAAPAAHSHQPTSPASGSAPCPPPAWTRQGPTSSGRISTTCATPTRSGCWPSRPQSAPSPSGWATPTPWSPCACTCTPPPWWKRTSSPRAPSASPPVTGPADPPPILVSQRRRTSSHRTLWILPTAW